LVEKQKMELVEY